MIPIPLCSATSVSHAADTSENDRSTKSERPRIRQALNIQALINHVSVCHCLVRR